MSDLEAAGDLATGGLVARAVEPRHGEHAAHGSGACANCRTPLAGPYCHACGQPAHVHRTIGGIGHELAHGVFHFEGKIWRTLPLLAWKPGQLTRRYVHGERARFVSPLALFLFAVFLTFLVFETVGPSVPVKVPSGEITNDMSRARSEIAAKVVQLEQNRAKLAASGGDTGQIDKRLAEARSDLRGLDSASELLTVEGTGIPRTERDPKAGKDESWLEHKYREAMQNPRLLAYKLQTSAYKYAWAVIVLSLPWMFFAFPFRRDVHLYDHTVFVTYSLSAVMLLLVIMSLATAAGVRSGWLMLLFPVHLFAQLRGAYRLGWLGAGWRTLFLMIGAVITLIIFALLLILIGALG